MNNIYILVCVCVCVCVCVSEWVSEKTEWFYKLTHLSVAQKLSHTRARASIVKSDHFVIAR